MHKIFTITGNLLAETSAVFDTPQRGGTARAKGSPMFRVGGKGVNVARAAKSLGMDATAVVFPAGFTGKRCMETLENEGIATISAWLEGETREGLVCTDSADGSNTTYLGADIPISADDFLSVEGRIARRARKGDILAFCGSFPGWTEDRAEDIDALSKTKNMRLCIDSYGVPLAHLARIESDIVKINRAELFGLMKRTDNGTAEKFLKTFKAAREKFFDQTKMLVVSDGANPILADFGGGITEVQPPKIGREVRATGCGDAMFARLIFELYENSAPPPTALRRAAAYASLCAECDGVGTLPPEKSQQAKQISQIQ